MATKKKTKAETKHQKPETPPPVRETNPANDDIPLHPIADHLLIPLWRAIPKGYKMKYARSIWDQFSNSIKNAASTSDTSRFLDYFCSRLGAELLTEDVERVAKFLASQDSRTLLHDLRTKTTLLVLHVRVANEKKKEEWTKRMEEQQND